jgi:hypothetical protein
LPNALSWSFRDRPGTAVTWPAGSPCIHSTNRGERRAAPLRLASVGGGAGRVRCSHRRIAGS